MSVSIVIGGQYGSEGKGKTAYFWAEKMKASAVVRVGGTNSGHTIYGKNGSKYAFRMLPTASISGNVVSILPAGAYIDIPILMEELKQSQIARKNLKIDPNAVIIGEEHKRMEQELRLQEQIGSTLSGTGAAVMDRVQRSGKVMLAKDSAELAPFVEDTKTYMRTLLDNGAHIVIEGTQGYGLSNIHAKEYPCATSRDTTAAGFLAETGLSPFDVKHVVMVIRAFPIRVAGHSGSLENEIDWKTISQESGAQEYFEELTTVTRRVRRVARFEPEIVKEAMRANRPDVIVMNHMDYLDYSNKNATHLSKRQEKFVMGVEKAIGAKITYCGNGEMTMIATGEIHND